MPSLLIIILIIISTSHHFQSYCFFFVLIRKKYEPKQIDQTGRQTVIGCSTISFSILCTQNFSFSQIDVITCGEISSYAVWSLDSGLLLQFNLVICSKTDFIIKNSKSHGQRVQTAVLWIVVEKEKRALVNLQKLARVW